MFLAFAEISNKITFEMKKLFTVLLLAASLFAISCSSPSGATGQTTSKKSVIGSWIMTDISFEGIPERAKVTVFDQASYECFKGSQWVLPSNGKGSYTLSSTAEGCSPASQQIMWSLYKAGGTDQFQFKKLYDGVKPKNVAEGYRVSVNNNGNTMSWRATVNFEDKNAYIIYTLQRR
ncbi:hypothetical protein CK934_05765 [Chitinophaga sp. MD30]|nr:hypothetical protein CK934_05765 [Chitinophaga sp. MD30]